VTSSGNTKECDTVTKTQVDWHGEFLHIDRDDRGYVTISRVTVFNPEEMLEIAQFILGHRYQTAVCEGLKIERKQKMPEGIGLEGTGAERHGSMD
jgi:hypothetical protein